MPNPQNKIIFTAEQHQFLRDNYQKMTNPQLAAALGMRLTRLRTELYALGLKRMDLEYFTKEQTAFLVKNYKEFGDTELAEIFEVKWFKAKGWTKKHIEKKRRYLKLKRTTEEKKAIKHRNKMMKRFAMCAKKRWETTGQTAIGEKRIWFNVDERPFLVIKTANGFVHYNRWLWQKEKGEIPPGMNVRIMSDDPLNFTSADLMLVTNAENAVMNSKKRTPLELQKVKKLQLKLQKIITQKSR